MVKHSTTSPVAAVLARSLTLAILTSVPGLGAVPQWGFARYSVKIIEAG